MNARIQAGGERCVLSTPQNVSFLLNHAGKRNNNLKTPRILMLFVGRPPYVGASFDPRAKAPSFSNFGSAPKIGFDSESNCFRAQAIWVTFLFDKATISVEI